MDLIMEVVEQLEKIVEQGSGFLPVFPPPQAPGAREQELCSVLNPCFFTEWIQQLQAGLPVTMPAAGLGTEHLHQACFSFPMALPWFN